MRAPVVRFVDEAVGVPDHALRGVMNDQTRYVLPFPTNSFEGKFETTAVAIADGAELTFALGAAVPAHGPRAVTFEIRECEGAVCNVLFSERVDFAVVGVAEWLERRVSLARFAGSTRRFVFRVVTTSPTARAFVANPTIFASAVRPPDARNVILLSLDTLRADRLGSYGYAHDTAPFIAETFARGGTRFDHCVAAATTTTPSHMTMFTALPPCVHEVGLANVKPLPQWLATVPELFRGARFTTGAITENGWVTFVQGFGRGFDTYHENKGPNIMEPKGQADVMFARAEAWLRAHQDERFFLFLHTYQVHSPYVPPAEYASLFSEQARVPPQGVADSANYDREIRFTDDMLRKFFATIGELGLDRNTVVLLTADHGEEFGEHGCFQHGEQLYDEVTRVPLMLWGAGIPRGLTVAEPVGLIDVMPTLLELGGVPPALQAMGVSLVDAFDGGALPRDRELVTESWSTGVCVGKRFELPGFAVRAGSWKLGRYRRDGAFAYELYDLGADPHESREASGTHPDRRAALQAYVDGYQAACRARIEELRLRASAPATSTEAVPLDAREREKLRALGYVE